MQNTLELGAIRKKDSLYVAVTGRGRKWCSLILREKGGEWTKHRLCPDMLFPSVFTGTVRIEEQKEYEYILECDKGYFLDDRAKGVLSPDGFGRLSFDGLKGDVEKRKIFSDTLGKVCTVAGSSFDWKKDSRPLVASSEMIAYKLHVRGFTIHESSRVRHPGTYKGVSEKIQYLKSLGITSVILQPCYEFNELMDYSINIGSEGMPDLSRSRLFTEEMADSLKTRLNFWGYGAESMYFAPKASYASDQEEASNEFKSMVRSLHSAGIEVIMEMDYSSTLSESFILENLRFWAAQYHIDGFRLNVEQIPLKLIATDPFLSDIKLICSSFNDSRIPGSWINRDKLILSNDGFQDTMRRFLKGDEGQIHYAAELIQDNGRQYGKLNYIADHNGFTLNDLYSYDERHNEANGEHNHDGREANYSWNCGTEGDTKKRKVLDLRMRMMKNALALLFLSQGAPMLFAGDEFGNTHYGNNNPYCCDNEQGWVVWSKSKRASELREFTKMLSKLKSAHPVFKNSSFLSGNDFAYTGVPDISFHGTKAWYPDFGYYSRTLGVCLNGEYAAIKENCKDDTFLLLINTHWEAHEFLFPVIKKGKWEQVFSTHSLSASLRPASRDPKELVPPRTICLYIFRYHQEQKA